jgi:hypothetical protein
MGVSIASTKGDFIERDLIDTTHTIEEIEVRIKKLVSNHVTVAELAVMADMFDNRLVLRLEPLNVDIHIFGQL